jgi:lantibiotic modifying enzyme
VDARSSPDILTGAAGTGMFLLKLYEAAKKPGYLAGAEQLGDFLILAAENMEPKGVNWRSYGPDTDYLLIGYAHGPAGIGYYLLKLWRATRKEKYHAYAERAGEWIEDRAVRGNNRVTWPDQEPPRRTRFTFPSCHGNAGIGPLFVEFYETSRDRKYLTWLDESTQFILDQGINVRRNASICQGVVGNTAALYQFYLATRDTPSSRHAGLLDQVRSGVKLLADTVRKSPTGYYWEAPDAKEDYSYMTGISGIGDFYIWLATNGKRAMLGPLGFGDDL